MSKFVRLPSGRGVDTEQIERYSPLYENHAITLRYLHGSSENIEGVDARALYAYLIANSVQIGEDGREVVATEPAKETFSPLYIRYLKALDAAYPQYISETATFDDFELAFDEVESLVLERYIRPKGNGYTLTEYGRFTLVDMQ